MAKKIEQEPSLHQAETIQDLPAEQASVVKTVESAPGGSGTWPPPVHVPPKRSRLSLVMQVSVIILALLLIVSGLGLIIYSTTRQYHTTLRVVATREVRATQGVISTAQAQQQATMQILSTAQANIDATATAQANDSAIATAGIDNATATATSFGNLLNQATTGTPTLTDSLSDNTGKAKWDEGNTIASSTTNAGCIFKNGQYVVGEAQQGYLQPCIAQQTQFSNFAYQVQVTFSKGTQGRAGLLFQVDSTNQAYYFFSIGNDGSYALDLYTNNGQVTNLVRGISTTITTGIGQANQLAILAKSGAYYLYANGQYINTVTDSTLGSGKIGLAVVDRNTPTEAEFSNAQVWKG